MGAATAVHDALRGYLDEGELLVHWCVVMEVATDEGGRYLAHRAGGGADGEDSPMCWTALGMLQASADDALVQLREGTSSADDDD